MDRAVLDAYGYDDLRPRYDYRTQLDERVRFTWDDDTRDEVLARLLEENRQRASAQRAEEATKPKAKGAKRRGGGDDGGGRLPGM